MYQFAVFVHLLAAITWVGGLLFLVMVVVPLARRQMASGARRADPSVQTERDRDETQAHRQALTSGANPPEALSRGAGPPPGAPVGQGAAFLRLVARRFTPVAWGSIALLVVSGLYLAVVQWDVTPTEFFSGKSHFVRVLQAKVGLVALAILLSALHDFVIGPRLASALERGPEAARSPDVVRTRRILLLLARVNTLLVLVIVFLGVFLVRP